MEEYITNFDTTAELEAFSATTEFKKPHVAFTKDTGKVHYFELPHDYSKDYLTFRAREQGTFKLTIGSAVTTSTLQSISYSTDNGETWTTTNNVNDQTVTITTPTVNIGDKVLWKGAGVGVSTTINNSNRPSTSSIFSSTGEFDAEGNILSLVWGDDFISKDYVVEGSSYNFALLFYANTGHVGTNYARVVSAKNLCLPIKNVPTCCYFRMFQSNTLTETPLVIAAESMGASGCTSMFYSCTSITTTPELPATTLAMYCYINMFYGCTSLTTAPVLHATTLADWCYCNMFWGCTSLTTAPELPATTLVRYCYSNIFYNCKSLTTAPELPATTLASGCCYEMFYGCSSLTTAPELPATTLKDYCYYGMFRYCTKLNSIKCLATNISASNCTTDWVYGVAGSGTFTKAASMSDWTTSSNGIPSGWTVVDT